MMRATLMLAGLAAAGCSDDCRNEVAAIARSPDGQKAAVLFQRNCGATTGFSSQVSVLETGKLPSGRGNAFIADSGDGAASGEWGGPKVELKWLSADHLLVRYACGSRVFEQARAMSGVRISYQIGQ